MVGDVVTPRPLPADWAPGTGFGRMMSGADERAEMARIQEGWMARVKACKGGQFPGTRTLGMVR